MATQYYTATSLDGFIATEDHSLDWLLQFGDVGETSYPEFIREVGAAAMGSSTYEWMLRNHVKPGTAEEAPWPYEMPVWVFSRRTLPRVEGADVRFVSGDVRPIHAAMLAAAAGRNLWVVGGGDLAAQFHEAGLLDEIIVQVAPVTLGSGRPLLPRRIVTPPLRLASVKAFGPGLAELRYAVPRPKGADAG